YLEAYFYFRPEEAGVYAVQAIVKNAKGEVKDICTSNACDVIVKPLNINAYYVPPLPNAAGKRVYVKAYGAGGVAPYYFAYYVYKGSTAIVKTPYEYYRHSYNYKISSPGNYRVVAFVKDAQGAIKVKYLDWFTVP
ncbi:MAG: hypothetical protein GYA87_04690, partial [Christensenellaceae bacterium]|nr:hypothetical protein [Christensenellaceae bacterium]